MSRSRPIETNPATRFFRWNGGDGSLEYYDKEKKQNIEVPLPFEFLVVDELATITGYCEPDESGYWSNEVRSVAREPFTVKTAKGTKETGFYRDLTDVRSKGAKYAKSVYIVFFENDEAMLGNLKVTGAALTPWIELAKTCKVENGKVAIIGADEQRKGSEKRPIVYFVPTFEYQHSTGIEDRVAMELDKKLQAYLDTYLQAKQEEPLPPEPDELVEDLGEPISLANVPFGE